AADDEPSKMPVAASAPASSASRTPQAAAVSGAHASAARPKVGSGSFSPADRPATPRPVGMTDAVPAQFPPMDRPAPSRPAPSVAQSVSTPISSRAPERAPDDPLVREVKQMRAMLTRLAASAAEGEWPAAFQPVEERLRE